MILTRRINTVETVKLLIEPCDGGHYLDIATGCHPCGEGTFSAGGTTSSCTCCPQGKTVEEGKGLSETDCSPCKIFLSYAVIFKTLIKISYNYSIMK